MPKVSLCEQCDGKCCRYFALQIDEPTTRRDFDDVSWYLAHEGVIVFVEDGDWYLEVRNRCRHLTPDHRCRIYEDRPALCREHATGNCEQRDDCELNRELEFHSDDEIVPYAEKVLAKRKKKGKKGKKGKKRKKGKKGKKGKKDRKGR